MGEDQLEKFIKQQVEQLKTPNDPDLLWQKIQAKQKVEEKPKRRFFFFWWLGGASMLLVAGLLFTYPSWNSHQQGDTSSEQAATTSPLPEDYQTQSEVKSIVDETATTGVTKNDHPTSATSTDEQSLNAPSSKRATTRFARTTPNATTGPINKATNRLSTTAKDNAIALDSMDDSTGTSLANDDQKASIIPPVFATPVEIPVLENNTVSPTATREVPAKEELQEEAAKYTINNPFDESKVLPASELLPTLEQRVVYDVREIDHILVKENTEKSLLPDESSSTEKPWHFSNGLAFTYGKGLRTLSERSTASADYLQTRESSETALDAVRINLDVMAQHKSGMYIKSGLEYEQINERFEAYLESDSTTVESGQILAITIARDGTSTQTTGNGEVSTTYWTRQRIFNHYHSIDIPLLIGYSRTQKDQRLGWFVEGGASVNLWFRASGKIIDPTGQLLLLEDKPSLFKSQTGLSLVGAVGLTYQVTGQLSIWANPAIKYRLRSISSEESPIDQTYRNLGFNVGMRYYW